MAVWLKPGIASNVGKWVIFSPLGFRRTYVSAYDKANIRSPKAEQHGCVAVRFVVRCEAFGEIVVKTVRSAKDYFCDNCHKAIPSGTHHKMLQTGSTRSVRLHMHCLNPRNYYDAPKKVTPRQPFFAAKLPIKWA